MDMINLPLFLITIIIGMIILILFTPKNKILYKISGMKFHVHFLKIFQRELSIHESEDGL